MDVKEPTDAVPTNGDRKVVWEQHSPERQLPVLLALHFTGFAGAPGGVVAPGFCWGQADGVQGFVPPVGFTRRREFGGAVVHEVAKVFPDFGDVFDAGFSGFIAVDPEAIFLVEAAIFSRWGESECVTGAEG